MGILSLFEFAVRSYSEWVIEMLMQPMAWIMFIMIIIFYSRISKLQKIMYGNNVRYSTWNMFVSSCFFGLLAGLIATVIMTAVGVTFYKSAGIEYVILLSFIFMFINPRYVCLSYSGGILSVVSLLAAYFAGSSQIWSDIHGVLDFDVTVLMVIVALMHLVEAGLMVIDGDNSSVPVFMKKGDKVVGGFIMQRFWILPVLFYAFIKSSGAAGDVIQTPSWWPVIKPQLSHDILKNLIVSAMPIFAILGYGDFAVTEKPQKKVKRSAAGLLFFSASLFGLSMLSLKYYAFKYVAAIFAPLCHEAIIIYQRYVEFKGKPVFVHRDDGVMILDTVPGAPSEKMGLSSGDLIVSINDKVVKTIGDINNIFKENLSFVWIDVICLNGIKKTLEYKDYKTGVEGLGILTIPETSEGIPIMEERTQSWFQKIFKKRNEK